MCGRFVQATPGEVIAEVLGLDEVPQLAPRYNIAPTQMAAVIRADPRGRRLDFLRWGLIPSWAKEESIGNRLINARAETLAEKPAFRRALARRRCLVPATGFYEWRKLPQGKQPYFIRLAHGLPMALAGLWEVWQAPDGRSVESFTIVTTPANAFLTPIHDRMPAILSQESQRLWLDPSQQDPGVLLPLLGPAPEGWLETYPVSRAVNNPAHDAPDLLVPVAEAELG